MEKEVEDVIESIRRNPNWGHADTWKALDALDRSLAKPGEGDTGKLVDDAQVHAAIASAETRLYGVEAEIKRMLARVADLEGIHKPGSASEHAHWAESRSATSEARVREIAKEEADRQAIHRFQVDVLPRFKDVWKRLNALESRGLGVGEKGGEEPKKPPCSRCGGTGKLTAGQDCAGWRYCPECRPDGPAPAPSRTLGNGETAEERWNRNRTITYAGVRPGEETDYLHEGWMRKADFIRALSAAESAARKRALEKALESLSIAIPADELRAFDRAKGRIRALLAGGQEVAK